MEEKTGGNVDVGCRVGLGCDHRWMETQIFPTAVSLYILLHSYSNMHTPHTHSVNCCALYKFRLCIARPKDACAGRGAPIKPSVSVYYIFSPKAET